MVWTITFQSNWKEVENGLNKIVNGIETGIVDGAVEQVKQMETFAGVTLMEGMNTITFKYPNRYVRTGNLMSSIMVDIHRNSKGIENTFFVFVDENKAPYAKYVEFGHQSFEGYHFMKGAYDEAVKNLATNMVEAIKASLSGLDI